MAEMSAGFVVRVWVGCIVFSEGAPADAEFVHSFVVVLAIRLAVALRAEPDARAKPIAGPFLFAITVHRLAHLFR